MHQAKLKFRLSVLRLPLIRSQALPFVFSISYIYHALTIHHQNSARHSDMTWGHVLKMKAKHLTRILITKPETSEWVRYLGLRGAVEHVAKELERIQWGD